MFRLRENRSTFLARSSKTQLKDKDNDKEALFNVAFETDNISSVELLRRLNE